MLKNRDISMKYPEMRVVEKMYPKACFEGSVEMLDIPLSSPDLFEKANHFNSLETNAYGVQGSFRKLEID